MDNRTNINPDEKFDFYKEKFESKYAEFLEKIFNNIDIVYYTTNKLSCSIVKLENADKLKTYIEEKYNNTIALINVLSPMLNEKEIKYLHVFPFDKRYPELAKNDEHTFKLIEEMYKSFAMANRWEAAAIHYRETGKPLDLKWTKNTVAKINQDRIDLAGKNNAEHTLFKSTLDRRISKDKE